MNNLFIFLSLRELTRELQKSHHSSSGPGGPPPLNGVIKTSSRSSSSTSINCNRSSPEEHDGQHIHLAASSTSETSSSRYMILSSNADLLHGLIMTKLFHFQVKSIGDCGGCSTSARNSSLTDGTSGSGNNVRTLFCD